MSGGQKQRVNIARALYFGSDIVIFDDPLSAGGNHYYHHHQLKLTPMISFQSTVDAHVGRSLFEGAILGGLRDRGITVLLVTHAIHFLARVDYIYTMKDGRIVESGTYQELIRRGGEFAKLDKEYGGCSEELQECHRGGDKHTVMVTSEDGDTEFGSEMSQDVTVEAVKLKAARAREQAAGTGKLEGRLMVKEQRTTGSVSWKGAFPDYACAHVLILGWLGAVVYLAYFVAGRGAVMIPLIFLSMITMQASQVMNSYVLVWWQAK